VSPALRVAARLVDHIVTPTRDSFPLAGRHVEARLRVTGHGVDTARYAPSAGEGPEPGRLLAVGRLSPSKRYEALIDALAGLRAPCWRLRIASGASYAQQSDYEARLRRQVETLGLAEWVAFAGAVPYAAMPAEYRRAWALAHTSGTGSLDKVVLEAMACGTPVVSSAPSSRALLAAVEPALSVVGGPAAQLTAALDQVLGWPAERRQEAGLALRQVVERGHSLHRWADQVVALLGVRA
jgi:glycosyltransferase involved in cell wall biosynthesis